jgi:hypothetical protein
MPFPYFENISTDFTGTWSSARKRKSVASDAEQPALPAKRKANAITCPHTVTAVRASRQLKAERKQCHICLEDYFSTPGDHSKVVPVKMGCSHIFCRECIETHLSSSITCPLPWCEAQLALQPEACGLCAAWKRDHIAAEPLMVTVRAHEMLGSIKDALKPTVHPCPHNVEALRMAVPLEYRPCRIARSLPTRHQYRSCAETLWPQTQCSLAQSFILPASRT